jgi:hypothetical protein
MGTTPHEAEIICSNLPPPPLGDKKLLKKMISKVEQISLTRKKHADIQVFVEV